MKRRINTNELQSKRQLFAGKGDAKQPIHDFQVNLQAQSSTMSAKPEHISNLQTRISEMPQISNISQEESQPVGPLFYASQREFVQESEQEAILIHAQDRINQNLQEIKTLQILQKKVLDGGSQLVQNSFRQQLQPGQAKASEVPVFNNFEPQMQDLQLQQ